jgi:apolipoprotein N-acyltransferase
VHRLLQDWFLENTRREARGARIVVWPEVSVLVFEEDETKFLDFAQQLPREEQIYFLLGMGFHECTSAYAEQGRAYQSLRSA